MRQANLLRRRLLNDEMRKFEDLEIFLDLPQSCLHAALHDIWWLK